MELVYSVFNCCSQIWRFQIDLFGYHVSLVEVVVFTFVGILLFRLVRSFWD